MKVLVAILLLAIPQSDGWTTLKRGDAEIRVYRDAFGIPHLFAATPQDAWWAQGYVECQDRFYQMDLFRRGSRGQGSELRGKETMAQIHLLFLLI